MSYTALRMSSTAPQTTVADHPMATILSMLADAVGGLPQGVPPRWRSGIRAALPPHAGQVMEPLFDANAGCFPDCLAAGSALRARTAEEQFQALAATPTALLAEQLEADFNGAVPALWRPVLRQPERWLSRYVGTLRTVWNQFEPVWRRAAPLIERETERIGVAAVRGAIDTLLGGIGPRCRYADGTLYVDDHLPVAFEQGDRPLVLVPLLSGRYASVFSFDMPDVVWFGYPLPGLERLWDGQPVRASTKDALALLLGTVRASILRSAPAGATMAAVAAAAGCSAATASYHCAKLEDGGLIVRRRQGNEVRIQRTARGDALLDLLDTP